MRVSKKQAAAAIALVDEATQLATEIRPMMADRSAAIQRIILGELIVAWLKAQPKNTRDGHLDALQMAVELLMIPTGEDDEAGPVDSDAADRHDEGPPWAE